MPTTYQKILIAYDHSDTAKVAARKAVEIGKKFNSEYSTIFVMTAKNKSDEPGVKTFIEQFTKMFQLSYFCQSKVIYYNPIIVYFSL